MTENSPFPEQSPAPASRPRAHERKQHKKRWPLVVLWTFVAVLLVGGGAVAWYGLTLNNSFNQAEKLAPEAVFPEPADRPEETKNEALNILLLGSDTRGEIGDDIEDIDGNRSDTIMVAHIPSDRQSVQVMSIMRDNWVEIPGHGYNKINAAMALGGVPLVIQTVEGIIDVRIDHVAIIDFAGFEGLTDALGGVQINNPREFTSHHGNTHFPAGQITLTGEHALQFVRERYAFADGDYSRVANQQLYVKSVIKQVLSKDTLTSPGKIADSVEAFAPYLTVDEGLTSTFLAKLGVSMKDVRSDDITFFTSPTLGTGTEGKASVVRPDWAGLEDIAEALRSDNLYEYLNDKDGEQ
ncbi:LCP family protein [Timonella senegalensis]|uniref:LCP family protein n=1 Tax=Timonella senegalensis TaxID=1465825 RepID=UPI002FDD9B45